MDRAEALDALRSQLERTAVLTDFDGTLAPIVDDPALARPLPGATEVLAALAARAAVVAVVSGRPLSALRAWLPPGLTVVGLYGLERLEGGEVVVDPSVEAWRAVVSSTAERAARDAPAGTRVEPKGLSLTLHVRERPELAEAVRAWAEGEAARTGLTVRPARMSVELHPPVALDKGSAVRSLVGDLPAACFLGDDVGDLPAFAALRDLRAERGLRAVSVGVRSEESPAALLEAVDLIVDGPPGALALLRDLLDG